MASNQGNFDIQVFKNNRWATEAIREREIDARTMAKKFLSDKKCAGARVVANRVKHDGSVEEKVIFEETQSVKGSQLLKIATVEQIKIYCEKPRDFFSLESRIFLIEFFVVIWKASHLRRQKCYTITKRFSALQTETV